MTQPKTTHLDYAEEAEAAQRAEAWPQAAALWRRAADALRADDAHNPDTFDGCLRHAKYEYEAKKCDRQARVEKVLQRIAQTTLGIPTLRERKSDELDFHEVSAWGLKRALAAAYEAGRENDDVTNPVSLVPRRRDAMKKNEVKIGQCYMAKVTNNEVPVRIEAEKPTWRLGCAKNVATGRNVRIKTAQRLRRKCNASRLGGPGASGSEATQEGNDGRQRRRTTAATGAKSAKPRQPRRPPAGERSRHGPN